MTVIIVYLVVAVWSVVLLVAVNYTDDTWSDLWRVLNRPLPWRSAPRAIALSWRSLTLVSNVSINVRRGTGSPSRKP